jgi:hypothetical protein
VKVENNQVLKNPDGTPQTETLTLDGTNNWKMSYQASKYYALDFFEHIFNAKNISSYYDKDGLSARMKRYCRSFFELFVKTYIAELSIMLLLFGFRKLMQI